MRPTAKRLILGLLFASSGQALTVRQFIDACALFDITENNVRVTVARLSTDGLIQASGRGAYVLGPEALRTARQAATWQQAEASMQPWNGRYIAVHTAHLGRSDRKALGLREQALHMLGLRELARGFYLRPDNLAGGADALRGRLHALGLEPEALVFVAGDFDDAHQAAVSQLWDTAALNRHYLEARTRLERWLEKHPALEAHVAAREAYLLGADAIRSLVFDPWLPAPLVDTEARHAYVETVKRFDRAGKAIWNSLYHINTEMPVVANSPQLASGVLQ